MWRVLGRMACGVLCFLSLSVQAEVIDVDNAELGKLLAAGTPLVDVRTQGEWEQSGIIAGSRLMTFFDEQGRSNPQQWMERLRRQQKAGEPVILICRTGNRTRLVAQFLDRQGFGKIYNVRQGIMNWTREGKPVVPAAQAIAACRASASGC